MAESLARLRAIGVTPASSPGKGLALGPDGLIPPRLLTKPAATVFPPLPVDGQEYVYAADTTNGVFWRFRWYAIGAYWAFTGGSPLFAEVAPLESTTSTSYTDLGTAGPSVTIPFAADFTISFGCQADINGAASGSSIAKMAIKLGATATADTEAVFQRNSDLVSIARTIQRTGLAAASVLKAQYLSTGGPTSRFSDRWIAVTPVKK